MRLWLDRDELYPHFTVTNVEPRPHDFGAVVEVDDEVGRKVVAEYTKAMRAYGKAQAILSSFVPSDWR